MSNAVIGTSTFWFSQKELAAHVVDHIESLTDLKNLSVQCKALADACAPRIGRHLRITNDNQSKLHAILRAISKPDQSNKPGIKVYHIRGLILNGFDFDLQPLSGGRLIELFDKLYNLTFLKVNGSIGKNITSSTIEQFIRHAPKLRNLVFSGPRSVQMPVSSHAGVFKDLRKLELCNLRFRATEMWSQPSFDRIAAVCPALETLCIVNPPIIFLPCTNKYQSLQVLDLRGAWNADADADPNCLLDPLISSFHAMLSPCCRPDHSRYIGFSKHLKDISVSFNEEQLEAFYGYGLHYSQNMWTQIIGNAFRARMSWYSLERGITIEWDSFLRHPAVRIGIAFGNIFHWRFALPICPKAITYSD